MCVGEGIQCDAASARLGLELRLGGPSRRRRRRRQTRNLSSGRPGRLARRSLARSQPSYRSEPPLDPQASRSWQRRRRRRRQRTTNETTTSYRCFTCVDGSHHQEFASLGLTRGELLTCVQTVEAGSFRRCCPFSRRRRRRTTVTSLHSPDRRCGIPPPSFLTAQSPPAVDAKCQLPPPRATTAPHPSAPHRATGKTSQ